MGRGYVQAAYTTTNENGSTIFAAPGAVVIFGETSFTGVENQAQSTTSSENSNARTDESTQLL